MHQFGMRLRARVCACVLARRKSELPEQNMLSDREMFERLPTGDLWSDAELVPVLVYLYESPKVRIPCSWENTMCEFVRSLQAIGPSSDLVQQYDNIQESIYR